jgi:colanic acid/amylovoran biosynthesis glycosyltransferase
LHPEPDSHPVVASYCATFLKPEMLHIYRQITALHRVRPIVLAQKREYAERFPFDPVYVVPKPATHFLRRLWFRQLLDQPWQISRVEVEALTRILSRSNARLLHIYFGHIAVHLLPLIRSWPHPSIVSFHGADVLVDMNKPAYRRATAQMLEAARRVLVRSESLGRALRDLGCDPAKLEIVRAGIPLEEFRFRPRPLPHNGAWRLLQACRLIEKKGLPVSLRAFAQFSARYPQATFTIAGEGPMLEDLRTLARQLGLEQKVSFTGLLSQERLRELFYGTHLFLHPSETGRDGNQEGVPNSMLEAMASGLPVLATTHGGIPEAIENGVSGVLVPEGDVEGLSASLIRAAETPEALSIMAKAGSDSVKAKFDQTEQVRRLEDIYLKTMAAKEIP